MDDEPNSASSLGHVAGEPRNAGGKWPFYCEACDHEADATRRPYEWLVGNSHVDRCPGSGECLAAIGVAMGVPEDDPEALKKFKGDFKLDPLPFLERAGWLGRSHNGGSRRASPLPPERVPSLREFSRRVHALRSERSWRAAEARRHLRERGLDYGQLPLGLDIRRGHDAIVTRCYCGGRVVSEAFRWYERRPPGRNKNDVLRREPEIGSGWLGSMPPDGELVVLTAGFYDGFSGLLNGVPAISASCGCRLPKHLLPDLSGRSVAVVYDVAEEDKAEKTVSTLRDAGSRAWVVRLERLGLPPGGDLNSYYVDGGSTEELLRLVKTERDGGRRG